ncbi:helix-turn-helix transcriptional regulator [Synoicihabitans lomoniglobus]|uniref:WYL domain-containing transcriptional regulator n=1 Tax=Synoicihabitans lomoniglobus TaxID=2909285 RepID=A0AAF0CSJ3_9BACT|nr:transcriptional regulator [Opitutaceae bacterium LMO-M01]WED67284.1 WYL domain-containing transcriptional regulator [Opitutaceae bacterium LMO-M01]
MPDAPPGFRSRFSVERMMLIHERLRDGAPLNCTRFAAELDVSRKTIQRDIDHMRDRLGLPLDYDRTTHSYVYTSPVEAFPTVQMSEGDAVALFVAERALEPLRGTPLYDRLKSTFDRLTSGLKGTVEFTPADHDAVSFGQFGEGRTNSAAFDTLQKAHDQQREATFAYKKPNSAEAETRRVRPYHLTHRENLWYLVGHDVDRDAIRTFALPRMSTVKLTRKRFELPTDFTPDTYFASALGVVSGQGDYDIHIRFTAAVAERIAERDWHESQRLTPRPDGSVDLHLRLGSLIEIERWVLGWGAQAEVLAPPELRTQLTATTIAMAHRYAP